MNKRGQVTTFIIVAIVIVVVIVLFFVLRGRTSNGKYSPETAPVYNFIMSCLEEKSYDALYIIGLQGGYITPPENLSNEYGIAYYLLLQDDHTPKISEIENQISIYVKEETVTCLNNFNDFPDHDVKIENTNIQTTINTDNVIIKLLATLTISKGEDSAIITEFDEINAPVRLGLIYNSAKEMNKRQVEYNESGICLTCMTDVAVENNLTINLIKQDYSERVVEITDHESKIDENPYRYLFANVYF